MKKIKPEVLCRLWRISSDRAARYTGYNDGSCFSWRKRLLHKLGLFTKNDIRAADWAGVSWAYEEILNHLIDKNRRQHKIDMYKDEE